jgi:hypothetical protein
MNKHEELVHSSFPKPNKKAIELNRGSPIANIGMLQPEDAPTPMMNPHNPAEFQ